MNKSSQSALVFRRSKSTKPTTPELPQLEFYPLKAIKQLVDNAPAWLVSFIVHLLLLLTLALISTSSGAVGQIILTLQQGKDEITTELVEFSIEPVELNNLQAKEESFYTAVDIQPIEFETPINLASLAPQLAPQGSINNALMKELSGETITKNMFAGRTGALKQKLLREGGGHAATEDAVSLGLEWLKRNQLKDGSWSPEGDARSNHADRLYTTCFSLYYLEVYYRHMPIYAPEKMDDA